MVQNKSIIFKAIPDGYPVEGEHMVVETRDFNLDQNLTAGSIITRTIYVSYDPYLRGRMRDPSIKLYSPAYIVNEPMNNFAVGVVEKSANDDYKPGDNVYGMLDMANYTLIPKDHLPSRYVKKIENPYNIDLVHFIGCLGMPGQTAYASFYAIGKPKKGETIFISAASGAVGQIVGQLAKHEGLTVIGSVGDDQKLEFITKELKFDAGFNYKKESAHSALKRLAPNGIDIYYDNVGAEQLEAALSSLNWFGRIVACGMISQYNVKMEDQYGVKGLTHFFEKRLTMQGFIVFDENMGPKYEKEHTEKVSKWVKEGTFIAKVDITEGIENGPQGLLDIFHGKNFGKAALKI